MGGPTNEVDASRGTLARYQALEELTRKFIDDLGVLRATHQEHLQRLELLEGVMGAASRFAIISTDKEGIIRVFNAGAERMLGYEAREVLQQESLLRFHSPEEYQSRFQVEAGNGREVLEAFAKAPQSQAWTYLRKDGSRLPVSVSVAEMHNEEGALSGFVSIAQDRTEQDTVDRLKDDFVSLVSHELRTPLTSILGSLGLVCGGVVGQIPSEAAELLNIAHSNGKRLLRLINDILDLNKFAAGQLEFSFRPCELDELVKRSLEDNAGYAAQYQVTFRLKEVAPALVWADPDRLLQVMANLLSNAAKFSPPGKEVEIGVERKEKLVRVWVRDQGPGIPKEFQAHLFERFRQAHANNPRQRSGSGLGLSITRLIVEQHRGFIGFETAPHQGTTFYFELPILLPEEEHNV